MNAPITSTTAAPLAEAPDNNGPGDALQLLEQAWQVRDLDPQQCRKLLEQIQSLDLEQPVRSRSQILESFLLTRQERLGEALELVLDVVVDLAAEEIDHWHPRLNNTAALIYSEMGFIQSAVDFLLRGLIQAEETNDRGSLFSMHHDLALAKAALGDLESAERSFTDAEQYVGAAHDGAVFLAMHRAELKHEEGRPEDGYNFLHPQSHLWSDPTAVGYTSARYAETALARLALASGKLEAATAHCETASTYARLAGRESLELGVVRAGILFRSGEIQAAIDQLEIAATTLNADETAGMAAVNLHIEVLELRSDLAEAQGDIKLAFDSYRKAQEERADLRSRNNNGVQTLLIEQRTAELRAHSQTLSDKNDALAEAVAELKNLHAQVSELSLRDPLTGLHNRRYLSEQSDVLLEIQGRYQRGLCMMVMDVDHFKQVNDSFLHTTGDEVLVQLAEVLRQTVRRADLVCRFGGDEFVVMLPETNLAAGRVLAARVRKAVESHAWGDLAEGLNVTVSVGLAEAETGDTFEDLLSRADTQLYESKKAGRNSVSG